MHTDFIDYTNFGHFSSVNTQQLRPDWNDGAAWIWDTAGVSLLNKSYNTNFVPYHLQPMLTPGEYESGRKFS